MKVGMVKLLRKCKKLKALLTKLSGMLINIWRWKMTYVAANIEGLRGNKNERQIDNVSGKIDLIVLAIWVA